MAIEPLYSISGFGVGALVGMTGVGGGSLMTPLLILLFGIHPATAVGTDLLFAAGTKSVGAVIHARSRTIDWRVTGRLATGSVPATLVMAVVLNLMQNHAKAITDLITPMLAVALLTTAALVVFQKQVIRVMAPWSHDLQPRTRVRLTILGGAVLGVLVSLSSVGAGALGVTFLTLLYPELPLARIIGSDIAHAIPLTLLAGSGYWLMGSTDWAMLLSLFCGSVPGIIIGSLLATRVPTAVLRMVLAVVLAIAGGKMLV